MNGRDVGAPNCSRNEQSGTLRADYPLTSVGTKKFESKSWNEGQCSRPIHADRILTLKRGRVDGKGAGGRTMKELQG